MSNRDNMEISSKAIEFQPDSLEIAGQPLPWWCRHGIWLCIFFFAMAVAWACICKVDVIVQTEGKIVTDTPSIVLKPLERAVIKNINVKVGQIVKKDDILISFDPVVNKAEVDRLAAEIDILAPQFARLHAEFNSQEYAPSGRISESAQWQKKIFQQRKTFRAEKMNYFEHAVKQLEASISTAQAGLKKQAERLEAVKKIERMFEDLLAKNAASIKERLEISISRMQLEAEVEGLCNSIVEKQHSLQSLISNKNSYASEWNSSISDQMVKIQRELFNIRKQYEKAEQINSYVCMRSPAEAKVHEIAAFSVMSAVREAEPLVTLVPLDGKIELELEINPKDIGKVKPGAPVRIKLNAFPFQKHGTLNGIVRTISEDTFSRGRETPGMNVTYYRARVTVDGKLENTGDNFRLIPGMEAQGEIKVGRRRIIEYIIHPLIKTLDEAIREP